MTFVHKTMWDMSRRRTKKGSITNLFMCFSRYVTISLVFFREAGLGALEELKGPTHTPDVFLFVQMMTAGGFTQNAALFTDGIIFFSNSRTANKRTIQSQWL